ncbi:uncharacterized protein LOC129764793 [Toxorhynchites rutilus septentrionalis]|uniref:uncharacterized protein LOC129764793 n=1 Tax=Toxorhynchites rutilus septentrionalis TaxID=329112 RepID=UPI002478571C|nr:uncharacterized protein LOC129764793 [Toxorhynchites rutilus septentrionalis]XP_055620259.1 uncharacterized protein LOC129764793 [Toxorhynchites rutilus septentrionalis]
MVPTIQSVGTPTVASQRAIARRDRLLRRENLHNTIRRLLRTPEGMADAAPSARSKHCVTPVMLELWNGERIFGRPTLSPPIQLVPSYHHSGERKATGLNDRERAFQPTWIVPSGPTRLDMRVERQLELSRYPSYTALTNPVLPTPEYCIPEYMMKLNYTGRNLDLHRYPFSNNQPITHLNSSFYPPYTIRANMPMSRNASHLRFPFSPPSLEE